MPSKKPRLCETPFLPISIDFRTCYFPTSKESKIHGDFVIHTTVLKIEGCKEKTLVPKSNILPHTMQKYDPAFVGVRLFLFLF